MVIISMLRLRDLVHQNCIMISHHCGVGIEARLAGDMRYIRDVRNEVRVCRGVEDLCEQLCNAEKQRCGLLYHLGLLTMRAKLEEKGICTFDLGMSASPSIVGSSMSQLWYTPYRLPLG